ncbi:MAG: DUF2807 domain-containing protein [Candidatus Obscuribacterales bacterium]|nr:DUF2807 domain-containing protein [Candidatus Obscuribacterales bacterium]
MFRILLMILAFQLFLPAFAAKSGIMTETEAKTDNLFTPPDFVTFAQISMDAPEIILAVEGVNATIKRVPKLSQINVSSNCPGHWNCTRNVIRQVAALNMPKGVAIRADSAGGVALVNGKVYGLPSSGGQIKGLKIENGQVIINGQPMQPLQGSDKAGSCTGPDVLEVQVPDTYMGDLRLLINGNSQVAVDGWKNGAVQANVATNGTLSANKLDKVAKLVIDVQGKGKAHVGNMTAKTLVVNIVGDGNITIDHGTADVSNATISGTGTISLHGKYNNMQKDVKGQGVIEILD